MFKKGKGKVLLRIETVVKELQIGTVKVSLNNNASSYCCTNYKPYWMFVAVPDGLKYTSTHEWVKHEGDVATVGITDHAQVNRRRT